MAKHRRRKVSKRRIKGARNECCPVIRIKCAMVKQPDKRKKEHQESQYGEKAATFFRRIAQPDKKVCTVHLGNRRVGTGLTSEEAGRKVGALKTALTAKRCLAVIDSQK